MVIKYCVRDFFFAYLLHSHFQRKTKNGKLSQKSCNQGSELDCERSSLSCCKYCKSFSSSTGKGISFLVFGRKMVIRQHKSWLRWYLAYPRKRSIHHSFLKIVLTKLRILQKKINIFCSPTTIRAVVQEGDMSGEHSLNPYIVWRYLRNMHRCPSAQPSELDMVARALRALERKPNKTRKEETKLQSFRKRFRILYGAATQKQRDYVDNVDLGGGQRIDSTEAREYLCARIQYLRDFPVTDLPLLDMYIRELQRHDDEVNSKPPSFGEPSSYLR